MLLFVVLINDPSFLGYIVAKLHLNHRKASPCVFNFFFFSSSFYYRSSSWRLYMVVRQGFFSFFNCSSRFLSKLWPAKLYSKLNMVLNTCLVLRGSSLPLLAFRCNSFYFIFWDGVMSFFTIWVCISWFTCCQEWGILNPLIPPLELSWFRFHLKPSLRNGANCGAYR